MSGAVSASTIIAGIGAAAAVGSTAYGIYNGQKQDAMQKKSLQNQKTAEQTAEAQTLSTERQAAIAQNTANAKQPDITQILARAAQSAKGGVSGTMLTGPTGVDPSTLNLGKSTLLGS